MKILDTIYWTEKAKNRIKNILPQTLFGRALLIIVTPLILMQAISTFVFFGLPQKVRKNIEKCCASYLGQNKVPRGAPGPTYTKKGPRNPFLMVPGPETLI